MSITQISKIQIRTGSISDLPELDIGEFGFATDDRRLFIGNDPGIIPPPLSGPNVTEVLTNQSIISFVGVSSTNFFQSYSNLTGATGVVVHDYSFGSLFYHTSIVSNFTVNLTNYTADSLYAGLLVLVLDQGGTAYMPTALQIGGTPQTVLWQGGGGVPAGTPSAKDVVTYSILNDGYTYTVFANRVAYS